MARTPEQEQEQEEQVGEQGSTGVEERSDAVYRSTALDFDPLKELNLPTSYEEVLARFRRLQGDRAMESLN